ncbi:MAG: S8 family serine peptidase [Candidatus Eiseniibacteriota bacterium]
MYVYRFGGRRGRPLALELDDQLIVVRTRSRLPLRAARLGPRARRVLAELEPVVRFHDAGVDVLRVPSARRRAAARDQGLTVLSRDPDCRFVGRVLRDAKSKAPVVYTENFFIKFADDQTPAACRALLAEHGLIVKRELEYARNAWFVAAPEGTGRRVFTIADRLLQDPRVDLCHPELARRLARRRAFPQQWHLKKTVVDGQTIDAHASVEAAWEFTQGEGTIIAVIDDGVDIDHEEFAGSNKIVAPRDTTRQSDDPRPGNRDDHGTACAGVACANGRVGSSGVAPRARLMPVRCVSALGAQAEGDAFFWAARRGADVISCSWGPPDNEGPAPLPDSTRLAMDWAIANGRNGKGCVIIFAAGNGNESVDEDKYASYPKVIAAAACNDLGKKSDYSDFGKAIHCAFPSNDTTSGRTPGIWTTDRSGPSGYNPGRAAFGDAAGNYTNSFGGTSSACPGVAGVVALVLARNPALRWDQVKDVVRRSCDRIDPDGGRYDEEGHSRKYGFGRVNAKKAVAMAMPDPAADVTTASATRAVPIRDFETSTLSLEVGDRRKIKGLRVSVDIEHTWIGDLVVRLKPPRGAAVVLHDRGGGGTANLLRTYDEVSTPGLKSSRGKSGRGKWVLEVEDKAKEDGGRLRRFAIELRR